MSLQKFSIFHEADDGMLRAWHRPYALLFKNHGPVLDVGCGPGYFSEELAKLGEKCIGLDLDPAMVSLSMEKGQEAHLGDQHWIAQKSACFGGVHISHVVEHLWGDDLVALLENVIEALTPGGLIIIRTPNWENRVVRDRLFWMDHTHKRPYPKELLVRMLMDLGIAEIQSGGEPFGMNDSFIVAAKPPLGNSSALRVAFPIAAPAYHNPLKSWVRRRILRFLGLA